KFNNTTLHSFPVVGVVNLNYFFFQAEDGIRDFHVTGVQTCALPIYPDLVRKLILVGCPPFEERYAPAVHLTRMSRLGAEERREASSILRLLVGPGNAGAEESKGALRRLGAILSKADSYDPILSESADVDIQVEAFQAVWREAAELRKSGRLLVLGRRIDCPVVAIHGEYDPHPSDGVRLPLSSVLKSNRF